MVNINNDFKFKITQDPIPPAHEEEVDDDDDIQIDLKERTTKGIKVELDEVKDSQLEFEEVSSHVTPYSTMQGLIQKSLVLLRKDQPNASIEDLNIICELETTKEGDVILGIARNPDNKDESYYKGNIILRVTNKNGEELAKSKSTIYPPVSLSRVNPDVIEDDKVRQSSFGYIQFYCDAIEDACNQKLSDEKTKIVIESVKTGWVTAPDYLIHPEKCKFPERKVVVCKESPDDPDKTWTETATLTDRVYRNNRWERPEKNESLFFNTTDRTSGEYKPRVILETDIEMSNLSKATKKEVVEKIKSDRSILPKFLDHIRQDSNRHFRSYKDIRFRLLDSKDKPTVGLKQHFQTDLPEYIGAKNKLEEAEQRLKIAEAEQLNNKVKEKTDEISKNVDKAMQDVTDATKEFSDRNKKMFDTNRIYETDFQDLNKLKVDLNTQKDVLSELLNGEIEFDEKDSSSIKREISLINEKLNDLAGTQKIIDEL